MADEWITLEEAADVLRTTVGDLATELSRSGSLLSSGQLPPSVELTPAWPNVRVWHIWTPKGIGAQGNRFDEVSLRSRSLGAFKATHVHSGDLEVWAADRAARLVSTCKVCFGKGFVPSKPPMRAVVPCPMCGGSARRP